MKELRLEIEELEGRIVPMTIDWMGDGAVEGRFDTDTRMGVIIRNPDLGGPDTIPIGMPPQ